MAGCRGADVGTSRVGKCIDFGRYQGTPWEQLPESYLLFLASNECHASDEHKRRARVEIFQRLEEAEPRPRVKVPR